MVTSSAMEATLDVYLVAPNLQVILLTLQRVPNDLAWLTATNKSRELT
jgi:hypothetical protein